MKVSIVRQARAIVATRLRAAAMALQARWSRVTMRMSFTTRILKELMLICVMFRKK